MSSSAIALRDAYATYTWRDVNELLNRAANGLLASDLGPENRIAVVGGNRAETVLAHTAALLAGVSTVPINPRLTEAEIAYIVEDSRSALVFADDGREFSEWVRQWPDDEPSRHRDVALNLFYTSGTTGFPKGTFSRPPGDLTTVAAYVESLRVLADDAFGPSRRPTLVVCPLHHVAGLGNPITALLVGVECVIAPKFDAEATLQAIAEYGIGSTVMVPTHFTRLLALPADVRARYDVSSLERVGHTGAGCPVEVKRAMIEWFGPVLLEAYGATEAGAVCRIESAEWLEHPGSVGRCLDGFRALVVDGVLYFEADDGTGIEYRNAPEKTAAAHLRPGVFTLGDMGYVDDDGYVYVTDRAADMVISGGVNIYPAEAEHVLLAHPAVRDVAVIAVPHPDLGETPLALVEAATGVDPDELIRWCRERLAHYKCPTAVEFVDTVTRSPMGKLDKRALRAPYWPTDRTIAGG